MVDPKGNQREYKLQFFQKKENNVRSLGKPSNRSKFVGLPPRPPKRISRFSGINRKKRELTEINAQKVLGKSQTLTTEFCQNPAKQTKKKQQKLCDFQEVAEVLKNQNRIFIGCEQNPLPLIVPNSTKVFLFFVDKKKTKSFLCSFEKEHRKMFHIIHTGKREIKFEKDSQELKVSGIFAH